MRSGLDVFVVRHAVAAERDPSRWPDDCDRPLTKKGERAFRRSARGLARLAPAVKIVLSSPCARAWRTAAILAEDADWGEPQAMDALRPDGDAGAALAALARWSTTERFAIVGHEPMLSELCALMSGGKVEMKKGAVARLAVHELAPGGATLRWILPPMALRRLAR